MVKPFPLSILAMSTLAERLKERITELGVSQAELSRATGAKEPSVTKWFNGQTKNLKGKNLVKAAEFLKVSEAWLADGVHPKERGSGSDTAAPNKGFSLLDKQTGIVTIPRYDTGGSMGVGAVLRDQPGVIERLDVSQEWLEKNVRGYTSATNLCVVTGFGDSMRPMYNPGDPLIVDAGVNSVEFDAVYFFRVGDEGFIKRLQRIPGKGLLAISENAAYRDWVIDETMDFEVFGRVLKVWRSQDF